MHFKKILLLINTFFIMGHVNILHADECGVLRYLANRSNGVEITGNTCEIGDDIALGSEFNLMPTARLWFKSKISSDAKKEQGICQNRSPNAIRISVDINHSPWIKPVGLVNCSSWTNNQINCNNSEGEQVLSCVIALADPEPHSKGLEARTTSVNTRGINTMINGIKGINGPDKIQPSQYGAEKEQFISTMQPDIGLCRTINHTDTPVNITWRIETNGQVNTIIPVPEGPGTQKKADKLFIDCLSAVIKDYSYPELSKATWMSKQF